ncbi:MAG: DNA internalization-related competence protein ComEC/Rec2 [Bacteroidetes bacterium]|jgi:competence protein ComEC|nr:DNA internalization-related competence protein ComEC/Rec2 [Bacteroidota bacterium]
MRPDSSVQWNAYPAGWLAGALAVGIALAQAIGTAPVGWIVVGGSLLVVAAILLHRAHHRLVSGLPLAATGVVVLAVVCAGGARQSAFQTLPARHVAHAVSDTAGAGVLYGHVAGHPVMHPRQLRLTVEVDAWNPVAGAARAVTGRVQATLWAPWEDSLRAPSVLHGDHVALQGMLEPLPRRRNPADFDYGAFLQRQGVHAVFTIRDSVAVVVQGADRSWLDQLIVDLRQYVRSQIARVVPTSEGRVLLTALVLGDRTALDSDMREQFRRTGLMHLLAVSGLHVLLVGMVLFQVLGPLLRRLGMPWRGAEAGRAILTLTLLGLYMLVAGASVSVVRAVLMATLLIGGLLLQRSAHTLNTLGVAAVVLLLVRPTQLFDVGFQLSFTAVVAIVTLQPRLRELLPLAWLERPWVRAGLLNVVVSVGAVLGTLPVLLYHFGYASWAGIVLNLPAIPLTAGTLLAGLLALVAGGISTGAAQVFGASADLCAHLLLWITAQGDAWLGFLAIDRFVTAPLSVGALVLGTLALAQWPRPRNRWRLAGAALVCLVLTTWGPVIHDNRTAPLELVFFDVGHGDAALVQFPGGGTLLVDAGARDQFVDHGQRTLLPHLHHVGIRKIDTVVISHPHADHFGGLLTLLRSVPIGRVFHNGQAHPSDLFNQKIGLLDSLRIPHRSLTAGDTLRLDPSVRVDVLAPEPARSFDYTQANDASVVLRLRYGDVRVLFAGDAEQEAEHLLVNRYDRLLYSDVIKVGHHGSRTSSASGFVDAVRADTTQDAVAIISVGRGRRYGLPSPTVVDRWKAHGTDVRITRDVGAVWLQSDGMEVWSREWR